MLTNRQLIVYVAKQHKKLSNHFVRISAVVAILVTHQVDLLLYYHNLNKKQHKTKNSNSKLSIGRILYNDINFILKNTLATFDFPSNTQPCELTKKTHNQL